MDMVEISSSRLAELQQRESDYYAKRKLFKNLDKTQQELLTTISADTESDARRIFNAQRPLSDITSIEKLD